MKIFVHITLLIFLFCSSIFAETQDFSISGKNATAFWQKKVCPGDAVFVRICADNSMQNLSGFLEVSKNKKQIGKTPFYEIPDSSGKNRKMLLAGIPLSSYLTAGSANAIAHVFVGEKENVVNLSLDVVSKEFVSETIPLNATNTAIRTNDSDERWKQINKLNKILGTRNEKSVYSLEPMAPPTKATRRTSFFADRRIFAYSNGKSSTSLHYGIDYGVPTGSEVRACAAGKVVLAETRITTGWSTVIEHLPGLYSLYYHQNELKVKVGDTVEAGQLIGLSGATGLATGPHLHWEMRLNMEAVSPDFFTGDFTFEKAVENQ